MQIFKLHIAPSLWFLLLLVFIGTGCKRVEPVKIVPVAPKKTAESTQYIVEVGKDGQIISSREVADTKPERVTPPNVEKVVYVDAINMQEAARKAEVHVRRIMELRDKAEAAAKKISGNKVTITITINP